MADNTIELVVKINAQTGQLDVLGQKMKSTEQAAGKLGGGFSDLGGNIAKLVTAGALIKFFADSVKGAEEEILAIRRLNNEFGKSTQAVVAWSQAIQESTRFSDSQALGAIERLSKATKNLQQAQLAAEVAMNLSVKTGTSLARTQEILFDLINGNSRAVKSARDEFGKLVNITDTTQVALDKLAKASDGAAVRETGLTVETLKLKNAMNEMKDDLGNAIIPSISKYIQQINEGRKNIGNLYDAIVGNKSRLQKQLEAEGSKSSAPTRIEAKLSEEQTRKEKEELDKRLQNLMEYEKARRAVYLEAQEQDQEIRDLEAKDFKAKQEEKARIAEAVARDISNKFASAFADVILEGKKFEDAMVEVFQKIIRMIIETILQLLILKAIKASVTGGFGGLFAPSAGGGAMGSIALPFNNPVVQRGGSEAWRNTPQNQGSIRLNTL